MRPSHLALAPSATLVLAAVGVAGLVSCTTTSEPAGPHPGTRSSVLLSSVTTDVLPVPAGVTITASRGVSAAGYIFGVSVDANGKSTPYVWTRPYTAPAVLLASAGSIGGLDGPDDAGDLAGFRSGSIGYWSPSASGWVFTAAPAGAYTGAVMSGVNAVHAMTGWGRLNGTLHALWWSGPGAAPVELPSPKVTSGTVTATRATALNDAGAVVGEVQITSGYGYKPYAALWTRSAGLWTVTLLPSGSSGATAYDINEAGQIAGNSNGGSNAILWNPSSSGYTATVISSDQSAITRIDECGRMIGHTYDTWSKLKHRAWVWERGVLTQLPIPSGTVATEAQEIGADPTTGRSVIVGRALTQSSAPVPVRWTIPGCT